MRAEEKRELYKVEQQLNLDNALREVDLMLPGDASPDARAVAAAILCSAWILRESIDRVGNAINDLSINATQKSD